MSWAKLDDGLDEHPKVEKLLDGHVELGMLDGDALQELAGLAALGLWTLGLTNTSRRLTEGHLSKRVLRGLAPATQQLLVDRLIDVGLFDAEDGGVQIHDYLDHNPSKDDVLAQRAARSEAGRKGGQRSGEARRQASAEATASASAQAESNGSRTPARTRTPSSSLERADAHELPQISYRGKRAPTDTVRAAAGLLDVFNETTGRSIGATKGDGTASADLKQIVGALLAHPEVPAEHWDRAVRNTVANPPGWVDGRQLQIGDIVGERAIAHALANTGIPATTNGRRSPVSNTVAKGDALIAAALAGGAA